MGTGNRIVFMTQLETSSEVARSTFAGMTPDNQEKLLAWVDRGLLRRERARRVREALAVLERGPQPTGLTGGEISAPYL